MDSLNPSLRCGWRPKTLQILPIVKADSPGAQAILARNQCVAPWGVDSRASMMTRSTRSIPITGGLGTSTSPSRRCSTNLSRHLRTVGTDIPTPRATSALDAPVEHSSTMRHLSASAWADLRLRAHLMSWPLSSPDNVSSTAAGPLLRPISQEPVKNQK